MNNISEILNDFLMDLDKKIQGNATTKEKDKDSQIIAEFKEQLVIWTKKSNIEANEFNINYILKQYAESPISELPRLKKLLQSEIREKLSHQTRAPLRLPTDSFKKCRFANFPGFLYILLILLLTGIFFCLHSSIAKNADRLLDDKKATDSLIRNAGHGDLHLYENTTQDSVLNKQVVKISSKADSSIISKSYHNVKENKYDSLLAHRSSSIPAYLIVISLYFLSCLLILFFIYRLAKLYFHELVNERLKAESWKNFSLIEESGFLLDESDFKKFWDESIKSHFEKPVFQESSLEFLLKKIFLRSK